MFLFIAGVSTALSYRNRCIKAEKSEDYNLKRVRNEYMFRALIILIIALLYNVIIAVALNDPTEIWKWFFLLTVAISLFLAWPLLRVSKLLRIILVAFIWVLNQFLLVFLLFHRGDPNLLGISFHFFYNSLDLDPILSFFPFFLIGTVIGDILFDINKLENLNERKIALKYKLFFPCLIIGSFLIIFGILFQLKLDIRYGHGAELYNFPDFLIRGSFSWMIYTLGIILILISVMFSIETYELIKTERSYKFLFYFSYYSLTVYLAHNILYFLFLGQLNLFNVWFFVIGVTIVVELLLRAIYNSKWREKASLKIFIGKFSIILAERVEEEGINL